MTNKGVLSKNYYIDSVVVADFGTNIYNMMAEADQAMAEASEIIADIASLTERIPSQIRSNELLEACASAQAEIKSVDFLSYGQKVDQGLQNLLDHNQYITEHFIKNMGAHTEKMRGLGEEFKRLTELITYIGEGVQSKGNAFSAVSNAEVENTDGEEEHSSNQEQVYMSLWAVLATVLKVGIELVITRIKNVLSDYLMDHGVGSDEEIEDFTNWILVRRPDLLLQLYGSNNEEEVERIIDEMFHEIANAQNNKEDVSAYTEIYDKYRINRGIEILEKYLEQSEIEEYSNPDNWSDIEELLLERDPACLINLYVTQGEGEAGVFGNIMRAYEIYKLEITIEDVESLDMGYPMDQTQKETFVACWNRLVGMGLSETHIIAVMANIYAESGFSATNAQDSYGYNGLYNDDYKFETDDGVGYGILQWTLEDRKKALSKYANDTGCKVSDLETQLDYFQYEMEEGICASYWSKFLEKETLSEATYYFMDVIENPKVNNTDERNGYADCINEWYAGIK